MDKSGPYSRTGGIKPLGLERRDFLSASLASLAATALLPGLRASAAENRGNPRRGGEEQPFVDLHAHVFNGLDVPAVGFIEHAFLDADERPDRRVVLPLLYWAVEILLGDTPGYDEELLALKRGSRVPRFDEVLTQQANKAIIARSLGRMLASYPPQFARDPYRNTPIDSQGAIEQLDELLRRLSELTGVDSQLLQSSVRDARTNNRDFDPSYLDRTIIDDISGRISDRVSASIASRAKSEDDARAIELSSIPRTIEWALGLTRYRRELTARLIELYGEQPETTIRRGRRRPGNEKRISLFTPAMLDLDHWVTGAALKRSCDRNGLSLHNRPTVAEQIDLMRRITKQQDGRILCFVPFDPWRQIEDRYWRETDRRRAPPETALELVQRAIENEGFVGVKLYTPMGFQAIGNVKPDVGTMVFDGELPMLTDFENDHDRYEDALLEAWCSYKPYTFPPMALAHFPPRGRDDPRFGRFGEMLDGALRELYRWCVERDVPIMTHTRSSQIPRMDVAYQRPHPKYWKKALTEFPMLRVNLAHFGNMYQLADSGDIRSSWVRGIGEIIAANQAGDAGAPKYPHTYSDVGYCPYFGYRKAGDWLAGVLAKLCGTDDRERTRKFLRAVDQFYNDYGGQRARERVMYGSDWTMIGLERNYQSYLHNFLEAYGGMFPDNVANFFGRNAARYLGLVPSPGSPNPQTRTRLDRYFRKNQMDAGRRLLERLNAVA